MDEDGHDFPVALILPLGVLVAVHAIALAIGTRGGTAGGASFGAWGQVNITAALLAVVASTLIFKRYRDGRHRPDPVMLARAVAAADLAVLVVAAAVLRPWA